MRPTTSTSLQSTTPRMWSMSLISACYWVWHSSSESTQGWAETVLELVSHAEISHEMAVWVRIRGAQTVRPRFTIVPGLNSLQAVLNVSKVEARNHSRVKNGSSKRHRGVVDAKVSHLMHQQLQACCMVKKAAMTRRELEMVQATECFTAIQRVVCRRILSLKNLMKSLTMDMAWLAVQPLTGMMTHAFIRRCITREIRTSNFKSMEGFINQIKRRRTTSKERRKEASLLIRLLTMILL